MKPQLEVTEQCGSFGLQLFTLAAWEYFRRFGNLVTASSRWARNRDTRILFAEPRSFWIFCTLLVITSFFHWLSISLCLAKISTACSWFLFLLWDETSAFCIVPKGSMELRTPPTLAENKPQITHGCIQTRQLWIWNSETPASNLDISSRQTSHGSQTWRLCENFLNYLK